jgi:hypothetical protein
MVRIETVIKRTFRLIPSNIYVVADRRSDKKSRQDIGL